MNRERVLRGGTGYVRELGLDPVAFLIERLARQPRAAWLDLFCGRGLALRDAAAELRSRGATAAVLRGVDLVPADAWEGVELVEASVHRYETADRFDLLTCVHGLHYVGDKLGLIARASRWLTPGGLLVATFDVGMLQLTRGRSARRQLPPALRARGFEVDTRRHLVRRRGPAPEIEWPWRYLGADDRAGPGFTGERAVASHYD